MSQLNASCPGWSQNSHTSPDAEDISEKTLLREAELGSEIDPEDAEADAERVVRADERASSVGPLEDFFWLRARRSLRRLTSFSSSSSR